MSGLSGPAEAALAPLRDALASGAGRRAEQILEDARRRAASLRADADAEARRIAGEATAQGQADARADARSRSSRSRRAARERVLAAQEAVRLELVRRLRVAAAESRKDPRYEVLLERLTAQAHELLGPEAELRESPEGGVVAVAGTRRLDLSLPTLALREAARTPEEVSRLWTD
ncbi:V-type ATP synthase subunit E family protein [Sinomonas sp.]|uniref:V-type ATP synthase subunit E family protein n=1 Tax=Sinomonas sp. TaxID=1914986 RepID=UPI002FE3B38B